MDDLIDADFGKHDYDWLLTPPETPFVLSLDSMDHQIPSTIARDKSTIRSISATRASKVSASQSKNGHSTKPVRSNSLKRPSILDIHSSLSINNNNSRMSMLNTSIASVTSRPSTPGKCSTTPRQSLSSRPVSARSQTPTKARSAPSSPCVKIVKPQNSRPSTPTSRPQISANSNSSVTSSSPRLHSRSSTPTRKPTNTVPPPSTSRTISVGRVRNAAPSATRPSSPSPRTCAPVQPIDILDFPTDALPNLWTRLPERPVSAGRTRPGVALMTRTNPSSMNAVSAGLNRRHSLPVVSHNKFPENSPKDQLRSNGHAAPSEIQKNIVLDAEVKGNNKVGGATDSTGFGRTISKKSLDMALRHMDIKRNIGSIRSTSLFPQSTRSNVPKGRPAQLSDPVVSVTTDEAFVSYNGIGPNCNRSVSGNGDCTADKSPQLKAHIKNEREFDIYGSSRYDMMLLKEDSNNMNWLHNVDDKSDESPIFDLRFEHLPEPFGLL